MIRKKCHNSTEVSKEVLKGRRETFLEAENKSDERLIGEKRSLGTMRVSGFLGLQYLSHLWGQGS